MLLSTDLASFPEATVLERETGFSLCYKTHNSSFLIQTHPHSSVTINCKVERQDAIVLKIKVYFLPDEHMLSLHIATGK